MPWRRNQTGHAYLLLDLELFGGVKSSLPLVPQPRLRAANTKTRIVIHRMASTLMCSPPAPWMAAQSLSFPKAAVIRTN